MLFFGRIRNPSTLLALWRTDVDIRLTATPKGNGFQATITFSNGVAISSAEAFPSEAEAMLAAAQKLLEMPERIQRLVNEARDADTG